MARATAATRYHKRGWGGSTHTPAPVSVADHASDAAAILGHLGVPRAHVAGHSSGAAVAAQLALDHPETVHTLLLLELSLLSVPSGGAFFQAAGPAFEAYQDGEPERALALFMGVVSGEDWATCRALLDERLPGAVAQAVKDADTQPLWVEVAAFLRTSVPRVEERAIDGVGHLLHVQRPEPVARAMGEFLGRHPMVRG
jgi:pimeloyl-ACP methyl ester carboxylesterase